MNTKFIIIIRIVSFGREAILSFWFMVIMGRVRINRENHAFLHEENKQMRTHPWILFNPIWGSGGVDEPNRAGLPIDLRQWGNHSLKCWLAFTQTGIFDGNVRKNRTKRTRKKCMDPSNDPPPRWQRMMIANFFIKIEIWFGSIARGFSCDLFTPIILFFSTFSFFFTKAILLCKRFIENKAEY